MNTERKMPPPEEYPDFLLARLRSGEPFRLRLRRRARRREEDEWRELRLRPVLLQGRRHWQFVYSYPRRDATENLLEEAADRRLREHLRRRLRSLVWEGGNERCVVQFSRRGRPQIRWERRADPLPDRSLEHDRSPDAPLPANRPDAFLRAIGVMTAAGKIRASQRAKFKQINEFLKQLDHARGGEAERPAAGQPLRLLDCASGSATLSFAAQHYLTTRGGWPTRLVGIDHDEALIAKARALAETLHREGVNFEAADFHASAIRDYEPASAPDILIALHACDTATDESLALGIRSEIPLLLVAPCCHHHLQAQMQPVAPFAPLQRHGILEQRLGDLLTDALRALALEVMGYRCAVVQFVGGEHTDRNVMLRARLRPPARRQAPQEAALPQRAAREYRRLTRFWGVTPHLETLLGENFRERLARMLD